MKHLMSLFRPYINLLQQEVLKRQRSAHKPLRMLWKLKNYLMSFLNKIINRSMNKKLLMIDLRH